MINILIQIDITTIIDKYPFIQIIHVKEKININKVERKSHIPLKKFLIDNIYSEIRATTSPTELLFIKS